MKGLSIAEVASQINSTVPSIYRKLDPSSKYFDAAFPRPRQLGPRRVIWLEEEINSYLRGLSIVGSATERSQKMKFNRRQRKSNRK